MVYPHNEILFSHEMKNEYMLLYGWNLKTSAKSKKPDIKDHILCVTPVEANP